MAREMVVTGTPEPDNNSDRDLRPRRIQDMVGQRDVIERLAIAIDAARRRQEPLGHILFDGPPGLGKTTFATCIPRELGVHVEFASGPSLKAPKDVVPYLTNAPQNSVLFIDEVHRIAKAVEEYLYTAMEDFRIDLVLGEGINARTHSIRLNPFTLIGATTRAGLLSAPMRDRFTIREHLDFYTNEELAEIIQKNAQKLGVAVESSAALEVARRSRSTPRIANNRLLWIRDYAESRADGRITYQVTCDALEMQGVDSQGLDRLDRKYLETLIRVFGGGPTGVEAIAHTMNEPVDTLSDEIEPFLLRAEFVVRTPRGRIATPKAYQHLQIAGTAPSLGRGTDEDDSAGTDQD